MNTATDDPAPPLDLTAYFRTLNPMLEAMEAFGVAIRAAVEQVSPLIAAMYAAYAVEAQPQPRRRSRNRNHPQRRHNRAKRRK